MDKEEIDRIAELAKIANLTEELLRALRDLDTEYEANFFVDRKTLFYCLEFALVLFGDYEDELSELQRLTLGVPCLDQPSVDRLIKACFPELPKELNKEEQ